MKKIACVGYHYTGAGVIDDLFRECDNVFQGEYEAEMRFLHDPDGVSDLEYHLVNNPHRLSSGLAIKRFMSYAKKNARQINRVVGKDWEALATSYAENLAQIKYHGYTPGDLLFLTTIEKLEFFIGRVLNKFLPMFLRKPKDSNMLPTVVTYYSRLEEHEFLEHTILFVENVCEKANKEGKEYIMLDQFIGSNNPERYLRYVNDIKVIIVDRDPRDVYVSRIMVNDKVLPKDPHDFCTYYKGIRKRTGGTPNNCLEINFEDLIYHYEYSVKRVLDFVGIGESHHIHSGEHFNPEVSCLGTQLWEKYPQYSGAVSVIEKELKEYLYRY